VVSIVVMRHIRDMQKQARAVLAVAVGVGALGLATGCGSDHSQAGARDAVTDASCDFYNRCGEIGAGKTYETRDSCEVQVRASWDTAWPVQACDGKINSEQLKVCLSAIAATECGNTLDVLNTLLNKCPQDKICSGP
jgi:hypothetical protein